LTRRSGRADALVDRPALLAALGPCRAAIISQMARAKPAGPLYYSGATVIAAIDALALMLTSERDYFALRPHSVGSGPNPPKHCEFPQDEHGGD
jgi:hypothetical protein